MSKDSVLRALEAWLSSEECFKQYGEDEEQAEQYFWDNEQEFADSY